MRMLTALPAHIESRSSLPGLTWSSPIGANLRRIISLSVVIVRACGRSSKHGTSHLARLYPQSAVQGLLGAPLKAGHDDGEICGEAQVSAYVVKPAGGLS